MSSFLGCCLRIRCLEICVSFSCPSIDWICRLVFLISKKSFRTSSRTCWNTPKWSHRCSFIRNHQIRRFVKINLLDCIFSYPKFSVRKEAYTEGRILETIFEHPQLITELYRDFEECQLRARDPKLPNNELFSKIQKGIQGELSRLIFGSFYAFNR